MAMIVWAVVLEARRPRRGTAVLVLLALAGIWKLDARFAAWIQSAVPIPNTLVDRIVKRAKEAQARGEAVRKDDNPEVFKTRLTAYRAQTAPLSRVNRLSPVSGAHGASS